MDAWITISNQLNGRDKIARFLQYLARALWDTLETAELSPVLVEQFKLLEYTLSTFRKLLRFGKCLDLFYDSLRVIHCPDLVLRVTLTMSKLSQSLFLFADHFTWLARTGFFRNIDARKWTFQANKYWLLSTIMNLCRDIYEILRLWDLYKAGVKGGITRATPIRVQSRQDLKRLAVYSYTLAIAHKDILVDTVRNVCDVFIPLTALGYVELPPRTIGLLGAISSLAGLITLIEPSTKLTPM